MPNTTTTQASTNSSSTVKSTPTATPTSLSETLLSSGGQLWRSKLSWRVAIAVFLTIMSVQAIILASTIKTYETKKIANIVKLAKTAIIPTLDYKNTDLLAMPFDKGEMQRLIAYTPISGFSVYSINFDLLGYKGEPTHVFINDLDDLDKTYRSGNGNNYEIVLRPRDLNSRPYYIVTRLNSSQVTQDVINHVKQTIWVMLLLSAFVTVVLMIALGKWLLEPIMFLQKNLIAAAKNPESPYIETSHFGNNDEIGNAITLTQDLIRQNAKNIHEIKNRAQDQIHRLAYYDSLTGLPNRTSFLEKIAEVKEGASNTPYENNMRSAIITLDLDHFKDINDSMGHNVGDAILKAVGIRLRSSLPDTVIVARTGEDEFSVQIPLSGNMKTAKQAAEKVQGLIRMAPFSVFNEDFQIRASIGVSTFPDDGHEPDQVLKNADIALNRAKESGRDTYREYMEDFDHAVQARFQMLRDLRDAIDHNQLTLNYQPQLDLKTGEIIGAEALLRWWKPDQSKEGGQWISPADFIPIAEQSGLIVPIGEWVLETACVTAKKWHKAGKNIRIAVNVSGVQFQQSDIASFTKKILKKTGVEPHLLELEVTESAFMDDIDHTVKVLDELHALGVELAIDDFGTGYSSLAYLRQFPIDRLKIDQSFIRDALTSADDAAITSTIITLGHSLNLKVIAEGVETIEHQKFLMEQG
ncbi:MAG: EAL domain-containing protein [Alphaproteobacteria bacterium]|nr:EAL domain-containing protein [Alphaproteobacteria bacterium]